MKILKILTITGLIILFGFGCYTYGFYRARVLDYRGWYFSNFVTNMMYYTMSINSDKEKIQKKSLILMEDAIKNLTDQKIFNDQIDNKIILRSLISNHDELWVDGCLHSNADGLSVFIKDHPALKFSESTMDFINNYKFTCKNTPATVRMVKEEGNKLQSR